MTDGFYVSCRRLKEHQAYNELVAVLQKYTVQKFSTKDFRLALQQEIDSMTKKYFNKIFEHKNVFYIENSSQVSSYDLYRRLVEEDARFKYVQRVVPLFDIFVYKKEKIENALECIDRKKSYKIMYNEKMGRKGIKDDVFRDIVECLNMKVDLVSPHYYVVVEVFMCKVGISVLEDIGSNFNFSIYKGQD